MESQLPNTCHTLKVRNPQSTASTWWKQCLKIWSHSRPRDGRPLGEDYLQKYWLILEQFNLGTIAVLVYCRPVLVRSFLKSKHRSLSVRSLNSARLSVLLRKHITCSAQLNLSATHTAALSLQYQHYQHSIPTGIRQPLVSVVPCSRFF